MPKNELRTGIRIESEHSKTIDFIKKYRNRYGRFPTKKKIFTHIAKDHLKEDKKYYTKLKKAKL